MAKQKPLNRAARDFAKAVGREAEHAGRRVRKHLREVDHDAVPRRNNHPILFAIRVLMKLLSLLFVAGLFLVALPCLLISLPLVIMVAIVFGVVMAVLGLIYAFFWVILRR